MLSNTIYTRYQHLVTLLDQHPQVKDQLVQTYLTYRSGNPSVVNKHFRTILEAIGFNYHKQGYSPKEIAYCIANNDWGHHYCRSCGNEVDKFDSFDIGFQHHCNVKCAGQDPVTLSNRKISCLEKYGVDNSSKSTQARENYKATLLEKYGVEHTSQTKVWQDKWRATYAAKSDEELAIWQQRREETTLKNYGVSNPRQSAELQEKFKKTCIEKYGVEHHSQRAGAQINKPSRSSKKYTFPMGGTYLIQGFENKALDELLLEGYSEFDILLTNRPAVKYFWSAADGYGDDKWHYYHPDIVIPKENRIIEVKSTYTFNGRPDWYSKNLAKEKACIAAGFKFEFRIY